MASRKMVAFFSERNMVRSIIAEAYLRHHGQGVLECISFGIRPNRIHYLVYDILKSKGFSLNYSFSKRYEVVERQPIDILVVMHPDLESKIPNIPYNFQKIVWSFEDPTVKRLPEEELRKLLDELCRSIEKKVVELVKTYKEEVVEVKS